MQIIEIAGRDDAIAIAHFLKVAAGVYRHDPVWAAASENVFIQRLKAAPTNPENKFRPFIAVADGLPVARAVAILNAGAVDAGGNLQGWLGFFESMPGYPAAGEAVINTCAEALRTAGAKSVTGPKIDNLLLGLQVSAFDLPQTVFTNHNPPDYLEIFQRCGFEIKTRLCTYLFNRETSIFHEVNIPGFITRSLDRSNLPAEVRIFHHLQNSIFTGSDGWVPRTLEESQAMIESFLPFVDDDLVIIAEDNAGNCAGLLVCLPDIYQSYRGRRIDRARIVTIGVLPGWERNGVGVMMVSHLVKKLLNRGYQAVEASWILESNKPPQNLARRFNPVPGRGFVLLEKRL